MHVPNKGSYTKYEAIHINAKLQDSGNGWLYSTVSIGYAKAYAYQHGKQLPPMEGFAMSQEPFS